MSNKQYGESKYAMNSRPKDGMDRGCRVTQTFQRLQGGGRAPNGHSLSSHQGHEHKDEVCDTVDWKGSQNIAHHGRDREKGDFASDVEHTGGMDQTKSR